MNQLKSVGQLRIRNFNGKLALTSQILCVEELLILSSLRVVSSCFYHFNQESVIVFNSSVSLDDIIRDVKLVCAERVYSLWVCSVAGEGVDYLVP